jgi:hypothetical protein
MENEDKLARLVAELQRAVIGFELHRNRGDRPRPRPKSSRRRAA